MKLKEAVTEYLTLKQSLGMGFETNADVLRWFCRRCGEIDLCEVEPVMVRAFLTGRGPSSRFRHRWYRALKSFYHFAINRCYVDTSPLPARVPRERSSFVPYIYSTDELKNLLAATSILDRPQNRLQALTFRTLLLLLYGTGLRLSEATELTLADMDLAQQVITVRKSKFHKTRWVPFGSRLAKALADYAHERCNRLPMPGGSQAAFFATRTGRRIFRGRVEVVFRKLRRQAGIGREGGPRWQPRVHDLRHAFAVHRLVAWYREGADVQRMLPVLSTYLGHINIAATQRYLTMTPELLQEANKRFERFAFSEDSHDKYEPFRTLDPSIPFRRHRRREKFGPKHSG
ncbi:MAG: tyrosine-type recombinase/integrase [Anaerolineae bacterium]